MQISFDSPNKGDKVFIWLGWVGCDNFNLSSVKKREQSYLEYMGVERP
jgi:hypothetical protein